MKPATPAPASAQQQQEEVVVLSPRRSVLARAFLAGAVCVAAVLLPVLLASQLKLYWLLWAAAEAAFACHYFWRCVPHFSRLALRQRPDEHDAAFVKQKLVQQLCRVDNIMEVMQSWFLEPGADVRRGNLEELFAYAIYYRSMGEMEAEGLMPELEDLMQQLERRFGKQVPDGYNPGLTFMSHLWEPLRHIYRPLFVYVVMELLALLCHVILLAVGFRFRCLDGITYYTYRLGPQQLIPALSKPIRSRRASVCLPASAAPCSSDPPTTQQTQHEQEDLSSTPIVFLHGVGAGLLPYLILIFRLMSLDRPMVLPHSRHVSMRLVDRIPTVDEMADATAAMLAAHGCRAGCVLAHSYGTCVASRLVVRYPQLVHSLCLTDPVCFAMFMPDLLGSFLYRCNRCGVWWLDLVLKFVSSELHCCANFSRQFYWSSINLWDEHIPARTLVVLGGMDILSPTAHVARWLREHTHAQVMFEPSMHHAGFLLSNSWQIAVTAAFVSLMTQQRPAAKTCAQVAAAAAAAADTEEPDSLLGADATATVKKQPSKAVGGAASQPSTLCLVASCQMTDAQQGCADVLSKQGTSRSPPQHAKQQQQQKEQQDPAGVA